jgi:hypothetical protein
MIEERIRRAAEQILEDENLTGELDDAEANRLLEWGLDLSRKICEQTADMDEEQAQAFLEVALGNLRRTMRRINKLVGAAPYATPEEIASRLEQALAAASEVPTLRTRPPGDVGSTARRIQPLPAGNILNEILAHLSGEGEGEEEDDEAAQFEE